MTFGVPLQITDEVSVEGKCPICRSGDTRVSPFYGRMSHVRSWGSFELPLAALKTEGDPAYFDDAVRPCPDWDVECRHVAEPFGFFTFAWLPVRCRNGQRRWLVSVERHPDGTYTLGNRAH